MGGPRLQVWVRRVTIGLVAVNLVGAGVAVVLHRLDSVTPVSVDDAVAEFRLSRPASAQPDPSDAGPSGEAAPVETAAPGGEDPELAENPPSAPETVPAAPTTSAPPAGDVGAGGPAEAAPVPARVLPAEGVYAYATSGFESIDAFGGSRHDYPDQTSVTLIHSDCGTIVRWQPLEERWDRDGACYEPDGIRVSFEQIHHEFFGTADERQFDCPSTFLLRVGAQPGESWPRECRAPNTAMLGTVTLVAIETIRVGDADVRALHVHDDVQFSGDTRGTRVRDSWYAVDSGLLLRRHSTVDSVSDTPIGPARYAEDYTIELESLIPRS